MLILTMVGACDHAPSPTPSLRVFAAASLGDVIIDIQEAFEREHPALSLTINLAGSNVLARQISSGAQADLIISANAIWVEHLQSRGLVRPNTRRALLTNQLVVIRHRASSLEISDPRSLAKLSFRYLAIGNPQAVPAGIYAKRYLDSVALDQSTLWEALAERIAPTADVRRAVAMVGADPSILGIVYATDVINSDAVEVLFTIPQESVNIVYEAAVIAGRSEAPRVQTLMDFLSSPIATAIFQRHGFGVPVDGQSRH